MPGTVRVEPAGVDIAVGDGETVMHAAEREGYRWPTVCHGQAVCTTCFFEVIAGGDNLLPPADVERATLATSPAQLVPREHEIRLACQVQVRGDVTVRKLGVRRP